MNHRFRAQVHAFRHVQDERAESPELYALEFPKPWEHREFYLPVLNVQQPYATAIARWGKNVDNRSCPIPSRAIGKWTLILASQSSVVKSADIDYLSERLGHTPDLLTNSQYVKGAIVAAVKFGPSTKEYSGRWHNYDLKTSSGDYAWPIVEVIDFHETVTDEESENRGISGCLTLFWNIKDRPDKKKICDIVRSKVPPEVWDEIIQQRV